MDPMDLKQSPIYRVAVISSVPPDPLRVAGALILSRWLDHPQIRWELVDPGEGTKNLHYRILDRLTRTRFHRLAHWMKNLCENNPIRGSSVRRAAFRHCMASVTESKPEIILSVAHGPLYKTAYQVSKRTGIPLVLLAQDWWPAFTEVAAKRRAKEQRDFIAICGDSAATIAVSEGMLKELGNPRNATVLHDLPSDPPTDPHSSPRTVGPLFKAVYAGNLAEYGPMIEKAALTCRESDQVRLEVFGRSPIWWSDGMEDYLGKQGIYRGFIAPSDFPATANQYDCILATMSFDPELQQRMRTCFPSKIIELAQLGKPIIIWGPEDCSAVTWARKHNAALCVTDESPDAFRHALEELAQNAERQEALTAAIKQSARNEFSPEKIRESFMQVLAGVVTK
jgi:glycosyltransferase involved in cell wall biosynthesis